MRPSQPPFNEKRQFGRRQTLWHAWIKIKGREREPCVVRNFSVAGALLEFPAALPVAQRFRLMIDAFGFDVECFVRHRSRTGIGVYFDDLTYPDMPAHMPRPEQIVAILKQQAVERVASVAAADQD